ncbi:hypothetical protein DMB42_42810 [Nonomuraea sp. WAC 01424]|uniref:cold-shock protein n=1 Tax=Nonomuraea sp. WAC 01424 TaxID=2203200 RepID=UPI000F79AE1B|nr:cold shock domain-containing protein [Nonomuraea sp. WAC 01424]RSM99081.1 hypothetical protein DMB42_42810 [Nonomuraea sp. WAC 01424]
MLTGSVLQFDAVHGYGFVAPDGGGGDVFLHTSVFDGDRDRQAYTVRLHGVQKQTMTMNSTPRREPAKRGRTASSRARNRRAS